MTLLPQIAIILAFEVLQNQITTNWQKYIKTKKIFKKPVNSSSKKRRIRYKNCPKNFKGLIRRWTSRQRKKTECDKKLAPVFQTQLKPVKVRQHNKKKTVHKKGTKNAKVVSRRALASRKNKINEQISRKYGNGNMHKYGWIRHLETVIDGREFFG